MAFTVVRGFEDPAQSSGSEICIYTLEGEKIFVQGSDVEQRFENEPAKAGQSALSTFFIKHGAKVRVEVALEGQSQGPSPSTVYKYLDDGGTISKSRDDLSAHPMTIAKYIDDGNTVRKSLDDF